MVKVFLRKCFFYTRFLGNAVANCRRIPTSVSRACQYWCCEFEYSLQQLCTTTTITELNCQFFYRISDALFGHYSFLDQYKLTDSNEHITNASVVKKINQSHDTYIADRAKNTSTLMSYKQFFFIAHRKNFILLDKSWKRTYKYTTKL